MAEGVIKTDQLKRTSELLRRYIECAEYMVQQCQNIGNISGAGKLERKCAAELKYLKSLDHRKGGYNETHLRSSNLGHYAGILHAATVLPGVTHVLQPFSCPGRVEPLHVDVVAGRGHFWVKVIARKSQALHLIWAGEGQYGEKDIIQQAEDFRSCSQVHPVNFEDPRIVFTFYNGITVPLARKLRGIGVLIFGDVVPVDSAIEIKLAQISVQDSESDSDTPCLLQPLGMTENEFVYSQCEQSYMNYIKAESGRWLDQRLDVKAQEPTIYTLRDTCFLQSPDKTHLSNASTSRSNESDLSPVDSHFFCTSARNLSTENKYENHSINHTVTPDFSLSDSGTLNYIDSGLPTPWKHNHITKERISNILPPLGHNQSTPATDNMSKTGLISGKQTFPESDLRNNQVMNRDCYSNNERPLRSSVLCFVAEELLINPNVDYNSLEALVRVTEINVIENIDKVNLDITTLITLVSAVSHGGCYFQFQEKVLSEQAEEERTNPVLPKLQAFLQGKQLFSCETAITSFNTILETLGGPQERERARELLSQVIVVPDNPSFRAASLPNTGKIKERSKIIFGTGDSLKAVTATANSGFARAAEHQGVTFAVFIHTSRALTEQKESTAELISKTN